MTFTVRDGLVHGTGSLTSLTSHATDSLTVAGERRADSLFVAFGRASLLAFTFTGRYSGRGIQGILHGSEFDSVAILFRNQ